MGLDLARSYLVFKVGLGVLGASFGAHKGFTELSIALAEKEPTVFEAGGFAQGYAAQQYVEVRGRFALEHASAKRSTHKAHREKDLSYFVVPVVPEGWSKTDAVHVLATYGPVSSSQVDTALAELQPQNSAVGQLRPIPLPDLDQRFPELRFGEPLVVINEGTTPQFGPSLFFLALMVAAGAFGTLNLRELLRTRHERVVQTPPDE